jgi:hypothetical protein
MKLASLVAMTWPPLAEEIFLKTRVEIKILNVMVGLKRPRHSVFPPFFTHGLSMLILNNHVMHDHTGGHDVPTKI